MQKDLFDDEATKTVQLLNDFAKTLPKTSPLFQKSHEFAAQAQRKRSEAQARLSMQLSHQATRASLA